MVPAVKPIEFLFEAGTQYFVQLDTQQLSLWKIGRFFVPDVDPRIGIQRTENLKFIAAKKVLNCAVVAIPTCPK
jgi:hypothetical protein